jgi:hypothetical protein
MIRSRKRPVKAELEVEDDAPPVLEPEQASAEEVEFQAYVSYNFQQGLYSTFAF